jgi:Family of unknown function (DUF6252)
MKTTIVYAVLVLTAATLFSCRKEYSVENGNGLPADFTAQINGVTWDAAQGTAGASITQGQINITGVSADSQQLSITLGDTVIGVYSLNQHSGSLAVYDYVDSSNLYAYSTSQSGDTSQAGGTVTVTAIDRVNQLISGIFSFKVYRAIDGAQKSLTSGVFYNLPYTTSADSSSNADTLVATIDSVAWVGQSITATVTNGQLSISGSAPDGSEAISLLFPSFSAPGAYPLNLTVISEYEGIYAPTPALSMVSESGSLTILTNNTAQTRITGTFQFQATQQGVATSYAIQNGYFSVFYGQ